MTPKSLRQRLTMKDTAKSPAAAPTPSLRTLVATTERKNDKDTSAGDAGKIYNLPFSDRKLLATGPNIQIVDGSDKVVIEMPLSLFQVTSNKKELIANHATTIKLPSGIHDFEVVKDLVQHLKDLTTWKEMGRELRSYGSTYKDLQLCSAGDFLGMSAYTQASYYVQHLIDWYWVRLRTEDLPGYADLDAFTAVRTPLGDGIFRKAVNVLAKLDFEGKIPDPEEYRAYLRCNERFRVAVKRAKEKMRKQQDPVARTGRRDAAKVEITGAEQYKQYPTTAKERAAKTQAKWDAVNKKEKELATRVKAKLAQSGKKKWKADEASYLRRVYDKNLPVG